MASLLVLTKLACTLVTLTIPRCIQENFECNLNDRTFQLCITELDDLHYLDFESIEYNMGFFRTLLFEDDDDDSQNSADSQGEVAGAVQNLCVERKEKTKVLPLWTGNPNADLTADLVPDEFWFPKINDVCTVPRSYGSSLAGVHVDKSELMTFAQSVRPALAAAMADCERQDGLAETGFDEEGGL